MDSRDPISLMESQEVPGRTRTWSGVLDPKLMNWLADFNKNNPDLDDDDDDEND